MPLKNKTAWRALLSDIAARFDVGIYATERERYLEGLERIFDERCSSLMLKEEGGAFAPP